MPGGDIEKSRSVGDSSHSSIVLDPVLRREMLTGSGKRTVLLSHFCEFCGMTDDRIGRYSIVWWFVGNVVFDGDAGYFGKTDCRDCANSDWWGLVPAS